MLCQIASRFDKHPSLLHLIVSTNTLTILLKAIAVIGAQVGVEIIGILV